nr:STAS domain-containing protein [Mycobacterium kubicae]
MKLRLVPVMQLVESTPTIRVEAQRRAQATFLVADGVLDGSTYRTLRDAIIKAALDEPCGVIIDVNSLCVPSDYAWSVFTSARWHVSAWPDVPILLVAASRDCRRRIHKCGVARYVPVHQSREAALDALSDESLQLRRRARIELPPTKASIGLARALIAEWLTNWGKRHVIPIAGTVATIFIENVLEHTKSAPVMIVETYRDAVTVAVEDQCPEPAVRREDGVRGTDTLSGLAIVAALCRSWGSTPTSSGKTVWALIGRENPL